MSGDSVSVLAQPCAVRLGTVWFEPGRHPSFQKVLSEELRKQAGATSGQRHSQALPFSAGICASRVGPPSLRKYVRKRFAARPVAFSKDISARTAFRGKSDHAFRRRRVHFSGAPQTVSSRDAAKPDFTLGQYCFLSGVSDLLA